MPSDRDVLLGVTPLIAYQLGITPLIAHQFCDKSYETFQMGFSAPNEHDWTMTALASFVALGILSHLVNWGYNIRYGDQSFQRDYPKTQKVTTVLAKYSPEASGVFLSLSFYDAARLYLDPIK